MTNLPAGRELDALVAEKVMGCSPPREKNAINDTGYWTKGDVQFIHVPHYSTEIAAAWEVVEYLRSNGFAFDLIDLHDKWSARFARGESLPEIARAETLPLGICLSALKALEPRPTPSMNSFDQSGR